MQASIVILHRDDGLLRAMDRALRAEGYQVNATHNIDALMDAITNAVRPVVLVVDEEAAGTEWRGLLASIPKGISCIVLTWHPWVSVPAGTIPIGKPFQARELLDALSAEVERLATL